MNLSISLQLPAPIVAKGRIAVIDQLKGLAMLLVLLYHGGGVVGLTNYWNGQIGVDIFLVLSGFTLALGALEQDAAAFWRRRVWRIFPPYWAALALFVALGYWVRGAKPQPLDLLVHVAGLQGLATDAMFFSWSDSFWFVGLIVPLYALIFLLRRWVDRLDVLIAAAGIATAGMCLYAAAAGNIRVMAHLPMRIPMFFLGVAAGRFARGKPLRLVLSIWLLLGSAAIHYAIFAGYVSFNGGIGALGLILAWLGFARLASKFSLGRWLLGVFAHLGVISYEIYLFHQPLIREYNRHFQAAVLGIGNPTMGQLFLGMMAVLAGLVLAATAWRWARAIRNPRGERLWAPAFSVIALIAAAGAVGAVEMRPVRVVVRIRHFAAMDAGVAEPVVSVGRRAGAADLVFARHEANSTVRIGIDHWGVGGPQSGPISVAALEGRELAVEFLATGITVRGPAGDIVKSAVPPHDLSGPVRVGRNDIGFSTAIAVARSDFQLLGWR